MMPSGLSSTAPLVAAKARLGHFAAKVTRSNSARDAMLDHPAALGSSIELIGAGNRATGGA
jgi:hypothetical protein